MSSSGRLLPSLSGANTWSGVQHFPGGYDAGGAAQLAVDNIGTVTTSRVVAANGGITTKHIAATTSSPTLATAAGLGTGPPAPVVTGHDMAGVITFGTGTSPAAGDLIVVTFGVAWAPAPYVALTCANGALGSGVANLYVSVTSGGSFTIATAVALVASQPANTYAIAYHTIG